MEPEQDYWQTLYYCPRCFTAKPFLHKHDPAPLVVVRWVGAHVFLLRLFVRRRPSV